MFLWVPECGHLLFNCCSFVDIGRLLTKKTINNIIVFVDDDGPGIPEIEYKNVTKPFYRIDKSRSLNKSGVGLGLSIAQDIVKSHGGNIVLSETSIDIDIPKGELFVNSALNSASTKASLICSDKLSSIPSIIDKS